MEPLEPNRRKDSPAWMDGSGQDPLIRALFPRLYPPGDWTLERVRDALSDLGDPHLAYPSILIGGTNGKGSVVATLDSVLRAGGHRVGRYTSPHLISFTERIHVGGIPAFPERLLEISQRLAPLYDRYRLSFFEAATVLAFQLFHEESVDVAVVEVGLGGRLDATNVLMPLISAVTNVDLDHTRFLGDTVEMIAREKAGIARRARPFLTTAKGSGAIELLRSASEQGAESETVSAEAMVEDVRLDTDGITATCAVDPWKGTVLASPLAGAIQIENLGLALAVLARLPDSLIPDARELEVGVCNVQWSGRLQTFDMDGGRWLLDVAHNRAGASALAEYLERNPSRYPRPRWVLLAVLSDKPWPSFVDVLAPHVDGWVLTTAPSAPANRVWNPLEVDRARFRGRVIIDVDFDNALSTIRDRARAGTVLVTGSCYTIGDALRRLHESGL